MKPGLTETPSVVSSKRILIVDDDVELCELLGEYLKQEGFDVEVAHKGGKGIQLAHTGDYALVILDVMLPGIDGYEVLRRIREASATPVIMLTARGTEQDRILGLESGADDYVPKPFNARELAARIQAVLRRSVSQNFPEAVPPAAEHLFLGDVELDKAGRVAFCGGQAVQLTSAEFELLALFLKSPGKVISRERLASVVLGRELSAFDRSIDVHVSNLRKKLGVTPEGAERIKSIRSIGYVYAAPLKPGA